MKVYNVYLISNIGDKASGLTILATSFSNRFRAAKYVKHMSALFIRARKNNHDETWSFVAANNNLISKPSTWGGTLKLVDVANRTRYITYEVSEAELDSKYLEVLA